MNHPRASAASTALNLMGALFVGCAFLIAPFTQDNAWGDHPEFWQGVVAACGTIGIIQLIVGFAIYIGGELSK